VGARETDLFELLTVAVVLPAVDGTVLVLVDFDPDDACAVHVAPGVDLAVAVRVVLEERQLAGLLVVLRGDALARLRVATIAGGDRHGGRRNNDGAEQPGRAHRGHFSSADAFQRRPAARGVAMLIHAGNRSIRSQW